MPAAAVIPAPVAYLNIAAVKKLVVGFLASALSVRAGSAPPRCVPRASLRRGADARARQGSCASAGRSASLGSVRQARGAPRSLRRARVAARRASGLGAEAPAILRAWRPRAANDPIVYCEQIRVFKAGVPAF